jgi:hypothetical protein
MGEGASQRRTEAECCRDAEEENDVGCRPQENRRSAKSAMGEGEGWSEEDGVGIAPFTNEKVLTDSFIFPKPYDVWKSGER